MFIKPDTAGTFWNDFFPFDCLKPTGTEGQLGAWPLGTTNGSASRP